VAETLNFARAAEIMNLSQPSISRQIHSLEEELGVPLFQRTTRSVALTKYGSGFLIDAKQIFGQMRIAATKAKQHLSTEVDLLSIGCCIGSDLDFFTNILLKCRQKLPDVHPYLRIVPHKHIVNLFMENQLDLVFGYKEDLYEKSDVKYMELFETYICCVVSAAHPYANRTSIRLDELHGEKIVVCNSPDLPLGVFQIQRQMEQLFLLSDTYYCDDITIALSLIRAEYGFAVLPDLQSEVYSDIVCIPIEDLQPLSYGIYYKKSSLTNPTVKKFLSIIQ
jgi:DNA-binding transcriptional LysR family regulator